MILYRTIHSSFFSSGHNVICPRIPSYFLWILKCIKCSGTFVRYTRTWIYFYTLTDILEINRARFGSLLQQMDCANVAPRCCYKKFGEQWRRVSWSVSQALSNSIVSETMMSICLKPSLWIRPTTHSSTTSMLPLMGMEMDQPPTNSTCGPNTTALSIGTTSQKDW